MPEEKVQWKKVYLSIQASSAILVRQCQESPNNISTPTQEKESQLGRLKAKPEIKDSIIPLILPRAGEHRGAFSTTEIIIKADTERPLQPCCCKV